MALILNLKSVENLEGKADRVVKVSFREHVFFSKIVHSAKHAAYFGQTFEWPVARDAEASEQITIQLYNHNKYLSNKILGTYTLLLQALVLEGQIKISEPMIDSNNQAMEAIITFEVEYYSPDGKVGRWRGEDFTYPLLDLPNNEDGESDTLSKLGVPASLMETASLRFHGSDTGSLLGELPGEDTASQTAMVDTWFNSNRIKPAVLEQELHRPRDFQVCITILEAQQLAGLDIDPVIRVEVGDSHKYTSIKHSTNCPFYSEYFVFDFHESPAMIFDKMITLTALHSIAIPGRQVFKAGNMLAGRRIGQFKCDVGTVYANHDHQFYHKWAVLLDPKDISEGPKGYIKCDLAVIGRGDIIKTQKTVKDDEANNIEGNLLLPAGVPLERQRASYTVVIYRGEDVPRTDVGIVASVRKAISINPVAFVDAFIKVSFAGHIGKTKVKKSYHPEWREVLTFIDMFPPLCNRIKVQLCDSDAVTDETIGTHFIELPQIMDPGGDTDGILPTMGPTWINMYGAPRNFKMLAEHDDLNEGLGEGAAYRGRVLIALKSTLLEDEGGGPSQVIRDKLRTSAKVEVAPKREFLMFSTLFSISMIDKQYKGKQVYFEISQGTFGNTLDAKASKNMIEAGDENEGDDDDEEEESALIKKRNEEIANLPCNSTTTPQVPVSDDQTYYYIPVEEKKPCLYVVSFFEDLRKRLYHCNLMEKIIDPLESGLEDIRQMMLHEHEFTYRRVKGVQDEFVSSCEAYIRQCSNLGIGSGAGKSKLDKYRLKSCKTRIDKMKSAAVKARSTTTAENFKEKYRELKEISRKLRHLSKEPQHSLPDIFVWMIVDKKRVAYHRIAAKDLLHATQPDYMGKHCGKTQTIFLKKPGKKNLGSGGWTTQAKLVMYMWLGMRDPKKKVTDYLHGLPPGYDVPKKAKTDTSPVDELVYKEKNTYQFRAYIFQARNLVGSDESGLSDPFARVIIGNSCKTTQIQHETLNPVWDETLPFDNVVLFGPAQEMKEAPPLILVEIFDYDTVGKPEFLGRAMVKPRVKLQDEEYCLPDFPPQLEWWEIYRGHRMAGEMLAAFELIQGTKDDMPPLPPQKKLAKEKEIAFPLPPAIKPTLSKFRIEVLFWGMRDMKRLQLLSVDKPRMYAEVAGQVLPSKRIANIDKNSNFEEPVMSMEVELPDNEQYWPPLTLRCMDHRQFVGESLVGTTTISHLVPYLQLPEEELRRREEERQRRLTLLFKPGSSNGSVANGVLSGTGSMMGSQHNLAGQTPALPAPGTPGTPAATDAPATLAAPAPANQSAFGTMGNAFSGFGQSLAVPSLQVPGFGAFSSSPNGAPPTSPPPEGSPPDGQPGDTVINMEPTVGFADGSKPPDGPPGPNGILPPPDMDPSIPKGVPHEEGEDPDAVRKRLKELCADLDWWSKYYVTQEDVARKRIKKANEKEDAKEHPVETDEENAMMEESDEALELNALDYGSLDKNKMKELQDLAAKERAAQDAKDGKKKKKKKKKRKAAKKKMKSLLGHVNKGFKDDDDDIVNVEDAEDMEDKSYITRLQLYPTELELVPTFGGFQEALQTFELYRGKKGEDDDDDLARVVGKFKGNIAIYRVGDEERTLSEHSSDKSTTSKKAVKIKSDKKEEKPKLKLMTNLPNPKPYEVHVMVYVVKALDLHPVDLNGKADPYLIVRLGRQEVNDKENKHSNQLNPVFGRVFEFDCTFPMDSSLKIQVIDYDLLSADDLVGETDIDLENRFLSKYRATCGISEEYNMYGYNIWRDPLKPSQILAKLCTKYKIDQPIYLEKTVRIAGRTYYADSHVETEGGELVATSEHLALEVLTHWEDIPGGFPLVPEHVETRPLFNPERPGVEQGKLEMWVDMFPRDMPPPAVTVDITARQPKPYELRCVIWNTDEVVLDDKNALTGEESSDILVKGYLFGAGEDGQATDVHYRSLTGEGNFNWRFVFPFEYLKAEERMVTRKKASIFDLEASEIKAPPKVTIQIWDADLVSADDFLGSVALDLNRVVKPAKDPKRCHLGRLKKDGSVPTLNLFKNKRCKGWWPVVAKDKEGSRLVGKVEAEFQLLTQEEAEKSPAGKGREEPDPLPEPNRPDTSFLWFMNPLKTLKYILWKNWKWKILKIFLFLCFVAFLALFLYTVPEATVNKMWGL